MIDYVFATITFFCEPFISSTVCRCSPTSLLLLHKEGRSIVESLDLWKSISIYLDTADSWHFWLFFITYVVSLSNPFDFREKCGDTPMLMTLSWNRARSKIVQFFIRLCCESFQFLHGACNHLNYNGTSIVGLAILLWNSDGWFVYIFTELLPNSDGRRFSILSYFKFYKCI